MWSNPSPPSAPRLESPLLSEAGFTHGFFTRQGGVSPAPFDSLNFTTSTVDTPENFRANLERVASSLGVVAERVYMPSQVHGVTVLEVDGTRPAAELRRHEADVVLSKTAHLACAVRSADCVPVLIACKTTGLVAAVHSGWKGCARGVVTQAIDSLRRAGSRHLLAAIGPHIELDAFEVGNDVAAELLDASPDKGIVRRDGPKPHVDLRRMVRAQLLEGGLGAGDIDDVLGNTVLEPERFFSFRRDGERSGRMLSAIVPRPAR